MSRGTKIGLDYFPVDTQFEDKVKLIEAKHGLKGLGILIKLYQKIYGIKGYFIEWENDNKLLFSRDINVDIKELNVVINDCLGWEVFNEEIYREYRLLTSHGIQIRYKEATWRRKKVEIIEEINLLEDDERNDNMINVNIKKQNVNINTQIEGENVDKKKQSKVKYSKVKYSNKVHSPAKQDRPAEKIPYAEIIEYLNIRTGSQYRPTTKKTQTLIKARWNEGFSLDDFKTVIDKKCVEWIGDKKMEKYLRPVTLFGTKFESYLNQLSVEKEKSKEEKANDAIETLYQKYREEEEHDKS